MSGASSMNEQGVLLESRPAEGVVLLRINRPEVLNALNLELRHSLAATFARLDADDTVLAVVITGSERAFCAGADLNEYVDAGTVEIVARNMGRLWDAIATCRKPLIAAVRGHALGGGCELAMHADMIIAGRGASFGQPEVKIGIMPGGGATQRLTRAVGKFAAMKILLAGEPFKADAALAMGLVTEVVDDEGVEARALQLAGQIAALPPTSVRLIKEAVLQGMNVGLEAGLAFERKCFPILFATADKTEGMRARLEKRAPKFTGR
ncbi:MAG: Enoyl-CoA hydratase [Polaromonas sp.]|nr:Enoyl-CoA hydratase [Polaromonas sp.]